MQRTSNFLRKNIMIDLKDAAFFLRLCETENVTRAAALSSVSPSTLSRTVSKLEEDLGATLCVRDQKGITITKAGKRFADYASKHTYMMAKKGWYPVEKAATTCDEFVNSQIKSLQYMKELFAQMGDPENFVSLYGHKNGKTIAEQMTSSVLASYLYSDGTADLEEQIRLAAQTLNGQIAY